MNSIQLRALGWIFVVTMLLGGPAITEAGESVLDRTVLPIPEPKPPQYTELNVRDVTPPPRFEVKPPAGAPNVLLVLVDDLGFAGTSKFGGPVVTPTFEQIANQGIYFNNFHTTAVCSPTRAAIKSGRNHHVNNMGGIIETGTAFPGNTGQIPDEVAPVAEGRIEHTQPMVFSADETADVGIDLATPVVESVGSEARSRFSGRIPRVTIEVHDSTP